MDTDARYEFLEKIGSGSFATVYRARDLELGREVAIKQIHDQYLEQPKQLERYWQEAQLLASLHHPNIVTIFDIHRDRGWLIMELMQANLAQRMAERQMDLRSLRTTIAHCLRALKYLHSRGIIHGDIKPGNLMIDARRRIKLGDFGLARRVSDDDGSLLQGTTKYMAPEVVSDEFGEIGPASDLYSLGFTAYDLMCGPNFESLFPGLSAFGRNKQVAWMMWHAAADRRLPEIDRVLEGVPDDLQQVIPKLCEKQQENRYRNADDALSDLKIDLKIVDRGEHDVASTDETAGMDPARKKRLMLAGTAMLASIIVCAVIWFLPSGKKPSRKVNVFMVQSVDAENRKLRIIDLEGKRPKVVSLPDNALISLIRGGESSPNPAALEDLQAGDRIEIEYVRDEGKTVMRIIAARPVFNRGHVKAVDLQEGKLRLVLDDDASKEPLSLRFPERVDVVLNLRLDEWKAAKTRADRDRLKAQYRIVRSEIVPGDRVEVFHLPETGGKQGYLLTGVLFVHRVRQSSGTVVSIDVPRKRMTVQVSNRKMNLPLYKECEITLQESGGKETDITLDKVRKGDFVIVRYDTEFRKIQVIRSLETEGTIDIVRLAKNEFEISLRKVSGKVTFVVNDKTVVQIGTEAAEFEELRTTDYVQVRFDKGAAGQKIATVITAQRPTRVDRRVLLVGVRQFDDKSLPELAYSSANVIELQNAMRERYAVEKDRLVRLDSPTVDTLKKEVTDILNRSGKNVPNVVIYISTHGFVSGGKVYLAGRKFDPAKITETGWLLDDLLALVEQCRATNKILLLDLSHKWPSQPGKVRADQPSTAAMLKRTKTPLKTTAVIAANSGTERGMFHSDKTHGLFAHAVTLAFRGSADTNGDLTITADELLTEITARLKAAGSQQTPVRISAK